MAGPALGGAGGTPGKVLASLDPPNDCRIPSLSGTEATDGALLDSSTPESTPSKDVSPPPIDRPLRSPRNGSEFDGSHVPKFKGALRCAPEFDSPVPLAAHR
jgi:hypothetical protein